MKYIKICNSITFYFIKNNSSSDISRKCILSNTIRAVHEIKHERITSYMYFMTPINLIGECHWDFGEFGCNTGRNMHGRKAVKGVISHKFQLHTGHREVCSIIRCAILNASRVSRFCFFRSWVI